jgi:hypothetical protein
MGVTLLGVTFGMVCCCHAVMSGALLLMCCLAPASAHSTLCHVLLSHTPTPLHPLPPDHVPTQTGWRLLEQYNAKNSRSPCKVFLLEADGVTRSAVPMELRTEEQLLRLHLPSSYASFKSLLTQWAEADAAWVLRRKRAVDEAERAAAAKPAAFQMAAPARAAPKLAAINPAQASAQRAAGPKHGGPVPAARKPEVPRQAARVTLPLSEEDKKHDLYHSVLVLLQVCDLRACGGLVMGALMPLSPPMLLLAPCSTPHILHSCTVTRLSCLPGD